MLGVAVNSDAGLVGQILLDEQNFDWTRFPTSWDDFVSGRAGAAAASDSAWKRRPAPKCSAIWSASPNRICWIRRSALGLSGSFFDRRYRDWDEQRVGGRVSLGYQWIENDLSTPIAYRGENVKISNPSTTRIPELDEVVGDNALHGFKWTIANDTRDSAFLATEGHFLQIGIRASGRQLRPIRGRCSMPGNTCCSASGPITRAGTC